MRPCATIIHTAPSKPNFLKDTTPKTIIAMWTTEEYAIKTFISLIWQFRIPKIAPPAAPKIETDNIDEEEINIETRIMPYPPNFKSTPAKIILPDTGASTWALGSQRWTPYIGNFTRNPALKIIAIKEEGVEIVFTLTIAHPDSLKSFTKIASIGSEANKV